MTTGLHGGEEMKPYNELVDELAALCGIMPEYYDIFGNKHVTPLETKKAILSAMKLNVDSGEGLAEEIGKLTWSEWKVFVDPVRVISVNEQPMTVSLRLPLEEGEEPDLSVSWSIEDEEGGRDDFTVSGEHIRVSEERHVEGRRYIRMVVEDSTFRNIGYYLLRFEFRHARRIFPDRKKQLAGISRTIITPDTCYLPPALQEGRSWGVAVDLYSLRSGRNWGSGDFTDLDAVVKWVDSMEGGFVGINPLHAVPNRERSGISPYSPVSRLYRNFIYLDVESLPEVRESADIGRVLGSAVFRERAARLRDREFIDYEGVASLKEEILKQAFRFFYDTHYRKNTARGEDFRKYAAREGEFLDAFAVYQAVSDYMKTNNNAFAWQSWPEEYHDPLGPAVRQFKRLNWKKVLYHKYVQWLIDEQLALTAERIEKREMSLGFYHDLAVGSMGGGSDAWNYGEVLAREADVGAPPDDFSPDGQNWGFPPLIPLRLKETGYDLFIHTIRKNMEYGGALRIDHALGLFRLFWIPHGMTAKEGAYVSYPSEDLLRIIALESVRNRTTIIAEDLGTIGENVRETLRRFRMFSYRLFYFERNYPDPSFTPPGGYPETALCSVTTHDLPTLYGYWAGRDLHVRRRLGVYDDDEKWREVVEVRKRDKSLILTALKSAGFLPGDYSAEQMTPELCSAIYRYLASTPCKLVLVNLNDVIGAMDQQNLPGNSEGYPSWMRKMPMFLEEITTDRRITELAAMLRETIGGKVSG
ncbi:MAG: 4-alpha-glucanotransferase [Candidatus Sulfobium sp.]|jgi:4-alpha-glucanotransferase